MRDQDRRQPRLLGGNNKGQATVPTGTFTQIIAGEVHTCAIRTDGKSICWGRNDDGQATVPDPTATVTQITAGWFHSCAVKTDGKPVCWGGSALGQLPVSVVFASAVPPVAGAGAYAFESVVSGSRPVSVFSLSAGVLPDGLVLDAGTGAVSGTATVEGTFPVTVKAGNGVTEDSTGGFEFVVDLTAPVTSDDTDALWHREAVTVTLTASDGVAGVDDTYYETGTDPATPTTGSTVYDPANKPVLSDGQKIRYFSVDKVGNTETVKTATPMIDTIAPAAPVLVSGPPASSEATSATVAFTGEPDATFTCKLDTNPATGCQSPLALAGLGVGAHTLTITQTDPAANTSPPLTINFTITAPPPPTVVTKRELSFKLAGKQRQLILNKNRIAVVTGCGKIKCRITITGKIRIRGRRGITLRTTRTTMRAGQKLRRIYIATSKKQRRQIRQLLNGKTTATADFKITAQGTTGKAATRTYKIKLRRPRR